MNKKLEAKLDEALSDLNDEAKEKIKTDVKKTVKKSVKKSVRKKLRKRRSRLIRRLFTIGIIIGGCWFTYKHCSWFRNRVDSVSAKIKPTIKEKVSTAKCKLPCCKKKG